MDYTPSNTRIGRLQSRAVRVEGKGVKLYLEGGQVAWIKHCSDNVLSYFKAGQPVALTLHDSADPSAIELHPKNVNPIQLLEFDGEL
jgi:hypothetical protein